MRKKETVLLDYRGLKERWDCSLRTVIRRVRKLKLTPVDYRGLAPQFALEDVQSAERVKVAELAQLHGHIANSAPARLLSMDQLRAERAKAQNRRSK